ncbi:hypothetical protein Pcaca02_13090 [Pectobacterium carotovorum subsp. carotovorum]|nr:hypothetical protein Pcaca02_13090 [Pectobacterium carotovorum subsp. carotovorum]
MYFHCEVLANLGFGDVLLSENGYQKLPNGLIIQWGVKNALLGWTNSTRFEIVFPIAFNSACFVLTPTIGLSTVVDGVYNLYVSELSKIGATIISDNSQERTNSSIIRWLAIGI